MRDATWFLSGWRLELHRKVERAVRGKTAVTTGELQENLGESYYRRAEIGKILKRLGWSCKEIEISGRRTRCWLQRPPFIRTREDYIALADCVSSEINKYKNPKQI